MRSRLVGSKICPFLQRLVITFTEKQLPFGLEHIDPAKKPEWFLALSPSGRHPLLEQDGRTLFDSAAIAEFVDESAAPHLMPADPYLRADNRAFIAAAADAFRSLFAVAGASDVGAHQAALQELRDKLAPFAARCRGPWFNGAEFSLVDAAVAPLLQRITWLEELGHSKGILQGMPQLAGWRDGLSVRPSVVGSSHAEARAWCATLKRPGEQRATPPLS